jgi:hypothetical protein
VVKKIEATIEKIPGLGPLIEKLMDSIAGMFVVAFIDKPTFHKWFLPSIYLYYA